MKRVFVDYFPETVFTLWDWYAELDNDKTADPFKYVKHVKRGAQVRVNNRVYRRTDYGYILIK